MHTNAFVTAKPKPYLTQLLLPQRCVPQKRKAFSTLICAIFYSTRKTPLAGRTAAMAEGLYYVLALSFVCLLAV